MAFTNVATAVTGQTYTAANYNTYVRDNFAAVWVFTTQGDLIYATSASVAARLGIGSAGQVLRVNSGGNAPEWGAGGNFVTYHHDDTGHTYAVNAWRDMPNSSKVVALSHQSTILCQGHVIMYGTGTYGFFDGKFNIDGVDIDWGAGRHYYDINNYDSVPFVGLATGIASGDRTIKIREICGGATMVITTLRYSILVIPE